MAYEHQGDFHVKNHLRGRNFSLHADIVTTSGNDLFLDTGSPTNIIFEGSVSGQGVILPDATDDCLFVSHQFCFFNESDFKVIIRDFGHSIIDEVVPEGSVCLYLKDKSTPPGEWVSGKVQLSKVLVDLEHIVGVSGFDGQTFIEDYLTQAGLPVVNEVPGGAVDCNNLVYTLAHEAIPGTMMPSLDGRLLTPGLDFVEAIDGMGFSILIDPDDSNRLNSPPHKNEDILVSYSKRVIF